MSMYSLRCTTGGCCSEADRQRGCRRKCAEHSHVQGAGLFCGEGTAGCMNSCVARLSGAGSGGGICACGTGTREVDVSWHSGAICRAGVRFSLFTCFTSELGDRSRFLSGVTKPSITSRACLIFLASSGFTAVEMCVKTATSTASWRFGVPRVDVKVSKVRVRPGEVIRHLIALLYHFAVCPLTSRSQAVTFQPLAGPVFTVTDRW